MPIPKIHNFYVYIIKSKPKVIKKKYPTVKAVK